MPRQFKIHFEEVRMFQKCKLSVLRIFTVILVLVLTFTACTAKQSIVGKWEVVSGNDIGVSVGSIYEFFADGTVNTGYLAVKYSMPDKTHIKFDMGGAGFVYEYTLSDNTLVLKNSTTQTEVTFKKYQEFKITNDSVSGTWELSYPDNSDCFPKLGLDYAPNSITLGKNGVFSASDSVDIAIATSNLSMNGQYIINGEIMHVSASGTQSDSGFLGLNPSQTQLQGEFDCSVTLSNSRLVFKDGQQQITLYIRTK